MHLNVFLHLVLFFKKKKKTGMNFLYIKQRISSFETELKHIFLLLFFSSLEIHCSSFILCVYSCGFQRDTKLPSVLFCYCIPSNFLSVSQPIVFVLNPSKQNFFRLFYPGDDEAEILLAQFRAEPRNVLKRVT